MSSGLAPLPAKAAPRREPEEPGAVVPAAQPATVQPWPLLAVLTALIVVDLPSLGASGWRFRPGVFEPEGLFDPVVRAAGGRWDLGIVRAPVVLAGLLVALCAVCAWRHPAWRPRAAVALTAIVLVLLLAPAVVLQAGLRESSAPWFFTNDSTYQIELAGGLIAHGENPYGHDYTGSGLERFYTRDGGVPRRHHPALEHLAYFPGTPLTGAAWQALPPPFDDYRFFVLLATLGLFFAALVFAAPLGWRLAAGAALAANPIAVRGAWFGVADAPSLLFLVLAFALVTRSRHLWASAALGVAVLLKQFALVAVPFFAVMLLVCGARRATARGAALVFATVLLVGFLPFLAADAHALWADTVGYGTSTYGIKGYGLAPFLMRTGLIHGDGSAYPFGLLVLLVWVPTTAWLLWNQMRSRLLWVGAASFGVSIFLLLYIARVFQASYLVWPLAGVVLAALLAARPQRGPAKA